MLNFISTIAFLLYIIKIIDFTYLFQIKEYRFDRFLAMFSDEPLTNIFYIRKPKLPAKTPRNILILTLSLPIIIFNFSLIFSVNWVFLIIYLLIVPFFSLPTVAISVFLTDILAKVKRQQLIERAREMVEESSAVFIGITGSYGKSTTKEFLYRILENKYKVAKTDANQNTDVGVAISILNNLKKDTEFFIAEIGAYKKGEIKNVCDLIKPKYGIITAIGNQHLELFGSKKKLIESKNELIECLTKNGKAYLNYQLKKLIKISDKIEACWFSVGKKGDITVSDIKSNGLTKAVIAYKNDKLEISTGLSKDYLINLLPLIALALDLKISKEAISQTIAALNTLDNKLSAHASINGALLLNDSYNSSYEGFLLAIKKASSINKRKIIILSRGLIELGTEKKNVYKNIIAEMKKKKIFLYTTDNFFKKQAPRNKLILHFPTQSAMLKTLRKTTDQETLLVIEGKFPENFIKTLIV